MKHDHIAPGWPGIPARWTSRATRGVGTALSPTSRVWFTLSHGILDEIYHPRLDWACTRDMGLIVTDGQEFFSEEKRHARSQVAYLASGVPAYRLTNTCMEGRYRIETIKPGAYPWRNHLNAWRPAHIHFSLFGESFLSRLVTQMYFPGDPLLARDPVFQSIRDARARESLISRFDLDLTEPEWALGYRFDIVLRAPRSTPFEQRT